jgi:hypothetical protein
MPPLTAMEFETLGAGEQPQSGWLRVTSPSPVRGHAIFRQRQTSEANPGEERWQEASIPLSSAGGGRWLVPFDHTAGQVTGLAIANPCGSAANLTARLSEGGEAVTLGLWPALGHEAFLPSSRLPGMDDRRGTMELIANGGCPVLTALRFTPAGAFTSVEPQAPPPVSETEVVFPQVADGGGFSTALTLSNPSDSTATIRLQFRGAQAPSGATEEWAPGLPAEIQVPPLGAVTVETPGTGEAARSGYAVATSTHPLSAFAVFRLKNGQAWQEATVPGSGAGLTRAAVPFDNRSGLATGIALANPAAEPATIALLLRSASGMVFASETVVLPARGHLAFELPQRFPASGFRAGTLEIGAVSGVFHATPLRFSPGGIFTSLPILRP